VACAGKSGNGHTERSRNECFRPLSGVEVKETVILSGIEVKETFKLSAVEVSENDISAPLNVRELSLGEAVVNFSVH
jgi:hypothetical protein